MITTARLPQQALWLRRWSLVVYSNSGAVLELSAGQGTATGIPVSEGGTGQILSEGLRMKALTVAMDSVIPNHLEATVYNLSDATARRVQNKEFSYVVLQAGYSTASYGVIFRGSIKMTKRGKESATDTYLIIYAADADFALTQQPLPNPIVMQRGSTAVERAQAQIKQMNGVVQGRIDGLPGGILPRQKVLWGLANQNLDETSKPLTTWSIQNGSVQITPVKGYLPGEAIILNVHSGLVGQPEVTESGVFVTALLNPAAKVRGLLQINNAAVNTSEPPTQQVVSQTPGQPATGGVVTGYPGFTDINFFASTADDGVYVIIYLEYELDTRANPWYMKIMCLLLDQSTQAIIAGAQPTTATIEQAFDNALGNRQAVQFPLPSS